MLAPEPELPETRVRGACPACQSERITPVGHVEAAGGLIKVGHRREACGTTFLFVRKRR
jgi:hypothetical protein